MNLYQYYINYWTILKILAFISGTQYIGHRYNRLSNMVNFLQIGIVSDVKIVPM